VDGFRNLYKPIKSELDRLNEGKPNNVQDSLIAETSIEMGFTLVTHDRDLFWVTTKFGGAVSNIHEVIRALSNAAGTKYDLPHSTRVVEG